METDVRRSEKVKVKAIKLDATETQVLSLLESALKKFKDGKHIACNHEKNKVKGSGIGMGLNIRKSKDKIKVTNNVKFVGK